jgi:hypothetical protein
MTRPLEQALESRLGVPQLLHMREVAAGLDREEKTGGSLLGPSDERRGLRKTIKGVVDFDRIEDGGIVVEPARDGKIGRIERTAPVAILPA